MRPITFYVHTDRINLLVQQYGEYLEVLTEIDKTSLMGVLAICLRDRAVGTPLDRTTIHSAQQNYPYTLSGRVVNACSILRGASTPELEALLLAIADLVAAQTRTTEKAPA